MNYSQFWNFTRKIVAIGRNYSEHAKELGNAVPDKPFFFLKPTTSFLRPGKPIEIPPTCSEVHHEVELGVIIGKTGRDIPSSQAMEYIGGYTLALDITARDIQAKAKSKGLPWSEAKGYDTFCPIGDFIPKEKIPDPSNVELWLKVDQEMKQKGSTSQMIFSIPQLIEHVSSIMTLEEGDIILTGTPSGVGPLKHGEKVEAGITGITSFSFDVVKRSSKLQVWKSYNTFHFSSVVNLNEQNHSWKLLMER